MAGGKLIQVYARPKPKPKSKPKEKLLSKRISNLENKVQAEKFRKEFKYESATVGQVFNNGSGYNVQDITPIVSVGDGYNGRTGSKVRLHSSYLRFQFVGESSQTQAVKGRIILFSVPGEVLTPPLSSSFVTQKNDEL